MRYDSIAYLKKQMKIYKVTVRFDIANPTATISDLRFDGYAIYANSRKNSKGDSKTFYRIGKPTRRVVAAGYRALQLGLIA